MPLSVDYRSLPIVKLEMIYGDRTYSVPHIAALLSEAKRKDLMDDIVVPNEIRLLQNHEAELIFPVNADRQAVEQTVFLLKHMINESLSPE